MIAQFRKALDTVASLLVVIAAAALLWRLFVTPAGPEARASGPPVEDVKGLTLPSGYAANVQGSGRVVLVEFADYECPFCARHTQSTGSMIKETFVDSGRIQHVFLNFPLPFHANAQTAAEAAECAALQGKFWEMHERLFAQQHALRSADLLVHAQVLGLDTTAFTRCLEQGETRDKVRRDAEEGRRLGVSGTPAFFLGIQRKDGTVDLVKRLNGAVPFEQFEDTIGELLTP